VNYRFLDIFRIAGEGVWLDAFTEVVVKKKHIYVNNESNVINKKLYTELFYVEPDLCCCIIHDFEGLADELSSSLEEDLKRRANHDYLTGFYNRFFFRERYDEFSEREKLGVTYLDINNLKRTNDTLGHDAGDKLIVRVSNMIRSVYGNSFVFRMGGDEFLIITPDMEERQFAALSRKGEDVFGEDNLAAIGYSFYRKNEDLRDCIQRCDSCMYKRKAEMKRGG
jgi:diguanylate cyclase (GGDEF)-like protein